MERMPPMTDMRRTTAEKQEVVGSMTAAVPSVPDYPWGLSISMCNDELDKLKLNADDMKVGDIFHIGSLLKVTSVSSNENEGSGKTCRVEFQITHMTGESEDEEVAPRKSAKERAKKLYTAG